MSIHVVTDEGERVFDIVEVTSIHQLTNGLFVTGVQSEDTMMFFLGTSNEVKMYLDYVGIPYSSFVEFRCFVS